MATDTRIQWATHTFTPCRVSSDRRVVAGESAWKRAAKFSAGSRALIGDLFEDWRGQMLDAKGRRLYTDERRPGVDLFVTDMSHSRLATMADVRRRAFSLIDARPDVTWLVVTERPENAAEMIPETGEGYESGGPQGWIADDSRPNIWLGVPVTSQAEADERLPHLLRVPCGKRFIVITPREQITIDPRLITPIEGTSQHGQRFIDWLIVRGGSDPIHPDNVRSLRDQCAAAGTAFWFDGWGDWAHTPHGFQSASGKNNRMFLMPDGSRCDGTGEGSVTMSRVGSAASGRTLDGREHCEVPA